MGTSCSEIHTAHIFKVDETAGSSKIILISIYQTVCHHHTSIFTAVRNPNFILWCTVQIRFLCRSSLGFELGDHI
jgi:hypothetical protein